MNPINHDAALAAGLLVLELFDTSPGAPKHDLLSQVVFIIGHAIQEAERLRSETRHAPEPSVN